MTIHVQELVYGDIHMSKTNSPDVRELSDNYGNRMTIRIGDTIIYASKSPNQSWISEGIITEFDNHDDQRLILDNFSNAHVGGEAYIGRK